MRFVEASVASARPFRIATHEATDRYISHDIQQSGAYEPYESSLFASLVRPGARVVDVGANIGWYSLVAASSGAGSVIAIEPETANVGLLRSNITANGLQSVVLVQELALARERRSGARLWLSSDNLGDHRLTHEDGRRSQRCEVATLDTVVESTLGADFAIDVLKSDTQGMELEVLRGAERTLRASSRTMAIFLECGPAGLAANGGSPDELLSLLDEYSLRMFCIDELEQRLRPIARSSLAFELQLADQRFGPGAHINLLGLGLDCDALSIGIGPLGDRPGGR